MINLKQISGLGILILLICLTIILIPAANWTTGNARIALSLIVFIFVPGYVLLAALFPKNNSIRVHERLALSSGLSLAIIPILGLILHYSPWGLSQNTILTVTIAFILLVSTVAWYRSIKTSPEERIRFKVRISIPAWAQMRKADKALTVTLAGVLLILAGVITWAIASPDKQEQFTEFYILDVQGTTENYPKKATAGSPVSIRAGIISHEDVPTIYSIEIKVNGTPTFKQETGSLVPGGKWEKEISFIPGNQGNAQKVELQLFKKGETQPYNRDPLYFYLDIAG